LALSNIFKGAPQMGKAKVNLNSVTTVGLDLAKHVFQIHAVDVDGRIVITSALRRKDVLSFFGSLPPCIIGLEACGSAHHWARELVKLGHDARLMPPNYVKAYVRRQKNDAADAAAICEAVTRPSMRFVPIRSVSNQAILMCHKVRELLVSQRTQLVNALRGHLAEVGIIAAQGSNGAYALAAAILEGDSSIPLCVRDALAPIIRELQALNDEIAVSDRAIIELVKTDANARRLMSVPGIGPITASAIAASVQDVGPSLAHESSQRSSDWRRDRTRLAVRSASDACQKWETDISESCWSSAPMLSSSTERPIRMG
jgi:transposase